MASKVLVGFLFAGLLLYLFLRQVTGAELVEALGAFAPWSVAVAFGLNTLALWVRTLRWRHLVAPMAEVPRGRLFRYLVLGFGANNVVPRLGEVLRPWLLSRSSPVGMGAAMATIVVERILDFLWLLAAFGLLTAFAPLPLPAEGLLSRPHLQEAGLGLLVGVVGALGVIVFMWRWPRPFMALEGAVSARLPRRLAGALDRFSERFVEGLGVMSAPRHAAWALVHTMSTWTLYSAAMFVIPATAPGADFPWWSAFFLLTVSALAMMVPSPGGIGAVHGALAETVALFGLGKALSKGAAILMHATAWVPIMVCAVVYLQREGLTWSELRRAASTPPERDEAGDG